MAKLPRLMQPGPSQLIDPVYLADSRDDISGKISIVDMPRIADLLSERKGEVEYKLSFSRNGRRQVCIEGTYRTKVSMQCQRCLEPAEIELHQTIDIVIVKDEDDAIDLPKSAEPFILQDKLLSLVTFIEDDLVLSVPLAASHSEEDCQLQIHIEEQDTTPEMKRPFEVLKDFKLKT